MHALVVGGRARQTPAFHAAELVVPRRPVEVVGDEEIEVTVPIVVEPRRRDRPELPPAGDAGDPGRLSDVLEGPVAAVVVQDVAVHARDVEVRPAVVVVVGGRGAHRVALAPHPRPLGHVAEPAPALVVVEPVPEARVVLHQLGDPGAVGEEDVQPAVAVEVEHGHAAQHRVDDRLVRGGGVVEDEGDAGRGLAILEPNRPARIRPCRGRQRQEGDDSSGEVAHPPDSSPAGRRLPIPRGPRTSTS